MANPNNSSQYLALTIGPIIKTLMEARRTRELWAGSFLLSTLMKQLLLALDPQGDRVLIPKIPAAVASGTLYGAGIYPDRLFMKADGLQKSDVEAAIKTALAGLAKEVLLKAESNDAERISQAVDFWQRFFRIRYVLKPMADISQGKLSLDLTPYLETQELEDTSFPEEPVGQARDESKDSLEAGNAAASKQSEPNELLNLFDEKRIYQVPLSDGLKNANRGVYDPILTPASFFPSTLELAAFELFAKEGGQLLRISEETRKAKDEGSELFYQKLLEEPSLRQHFRPRHKYFCIVQADGDNIGKAIKRLNDEKSYSRFSEELAQFGQDAALKINEFGGKPVYIGGDDLLFLAPVYNGQDTIFKLIQDLDVAFKAKNLHSEASLSFGLNVVYYKYPLFEAISEAYSILHEAKDYKSKQGKKKNAVAFRLTKHSGTYFSAAFSKNFLKSALAALGVFQTSAPLGKKGVVSALIFKIRTLEQLLKDVISQEEAKKAGDLQYTPDLSGRLKAFFEAFFNEWKQDTAFEQQREAVQELLLVAYSEAGSKKWLTLFYAMMRFIDFMFAPNEVQIQSQPNDSENNVASAG